MSFLEPWVLLALPAIALPIIIHLLNQRRHETVSWAASEFVKRVSRQNRGHAVLRQWLTLLLRMLAIAAMIFVISRPLATSVSGLSLLGTGRPQLVLVDRSPSMALQDASTGLTRREDILGRLDTLLAKTNGRSQRQLIQAHQQSSIDPGRDDLVSLRDTEVVSAPTDIPALVETALDRIDTDSMGPTDIWLCSDMQASDWQINSGRWARISQRLSNMAGTKLRILSSGPTSGFNCAVTAQNVVRRQQGERFFLELDLSIRQTLGELTARTVPVVVHVGNDQRHLDADLVAGIFDAKRVVIEISDTELRGGGYVSIPDDANPQDNKFFFAYAPPVSRRTVVVSDDQDVRDLMELVCKTSQSQTAQYECDVLPTSRSGEVNWSEASMIVWHADLPTGPIAERFEHFVNSGGSVLFLPPEKVDPDVQLFDVNWQEWDIAQPDGLSNGGDQLPFATAYQVETWRQDDDILASDEGGTVLPVDRIKCERRCQTESQSASALATFTDGEPLLVRAATKRGGAYFLTTLPTSDVSNFVDDGVVLFVMLHRCLDAGAQASSDAQAVVAGALPNDSASQWEAVGSISAAVLPSERSFVAGLYSDQEKIIAVNRSNDEDNPEKLDRDSVAQQLAETSFELVASESASMSDLASELWKPFMILVIIALLVEGWLSLPSKSAGAIHNRGARDRGAANEAANKSADGFGTGEQTPTNPATNVMQETV